jgi:subtilase family protein
LKRGIEWAAAQPWIDVISMSLGRLADIGGLWATSDPVPLDGLPYQDDTRISRASKAAYASGKLVFAAAGNEPTISVTDDFSGPAEVISVGGAERTTNGTTVISSKYGDFVSNFTNVVASKGDNDGYHWTQGTSFACPTAAGAASAVVLGLREHYGHEGGIVNGSLVDVPGTRLTNRDVRDALNQTASYWAPEQYDPLGMEPDPLDDPTDPDRVLLWAGGATTPVVAPWVQMGWGYVGNETIAPALARLTGTPLPVDDQTALLKAVAAPYMKLNYGVRETYWSGLRQPLWDATYDALTEVAVAVEDAVAAIPECRDVPHLHCPQVGG